MTNSLLVELGGLILMVISVGFAVAAFRPPHVGRHTDEYKQTRRWPDGSPSMYRRSVSDAPALPQAGEQ